MLNRFWSWYERHYRLNLIISGGLFLLQLVHLYWLGTDVIARRLTGISYFSPSPFWQFMLVMVDYTEIPALISTSILYLYELQKRFRWRTILFLVFLNIQWLHLFWITDEFVVTKFTGEGGALPLPIWLAWVAILIDYLEIPVIIDTIRRIIQLLRKGSTDEILQTLPKVLRR